MKKKRKISISIDKDVLLKLDSVTTNKSRLVEQILLEYINKQRIKIDDIIL
jgi:hypothetical protein